MILYIIYISLYIFLCHVMQSHVDNRHFSHLLSRISCPWARGHASRTYAPRVHVECSLRST